MAMALALDSPALASVASLTRRGRSVAAVLGTANDDGREAEREDEWGLENASRMLLSASRVQRSQHCDEERTVHT